MAFIAYVKTKGRKSGDFGGTTTQTVDAAGVKPETHSEVVSIEYRAHGALDPKTGKPVSHRQNEPLRLTLDLDKNYGRYMASMLEGEYLDLEIVFTQNVQDGSGGIEKAMTMKLTSANIADIRLQTGKHALQSSSTAKGMAEFDTRELYEISLMWEKLEGDSGAAANTTKGAIPWVDDWKKPGSAK